jgi:hypothetical protein
MSQRASGYERKERDLYETPEWVTEALVPELPFMNDRRIWEPACGSGKMVRALEGRGLYVIGTDIEQGHDFLELARPAGVSAIITNPPYNRSHVFIEHAMQLMQPVHGLVAMLLRTDFDHAASRTDMFNGKGCHFWKKLVLTRRIKWFEDSKGSPSFNHAWFIWDWKHEGPPTLAYGPR